MKKKTTKKAVTKYVVKNGNEVHPIKVVGFSDGYWLTVPKRGGVTKLIAAGVVLDSKEAALKSIEPVTGYAFTYGGQLKKIACRRQPSGLLKAIDSVVYGQVHKTAREAWKDKLNRRTSDLIRSKKSLRRDEKALKMLMDRASRCKLAAAERSKRAK